MNVLIARQALGLTQQQLADALGLGKGGQVTVSRWETGAKIPSGPVVVALKLMVEAKNGRKKTNCRVNRKT
jgi:DNA-binding transcriptional regulator YiaG